MSTLVSTNNPYPSFPTSNPQPNSKGSSSSELPVTASRTENDVPINPNSGDVIVKPQRPPPRPSGAINSGADRLLALIDEEKARIEAQNKKQLETVEALFQAFRMHAEEEKQRLVDRIRALEAELATTKGNNVVSSGGVQHVATKEANDALDAETTHLVQKLVKAAKSAPKQLGIDSAAIDPGKIPDTFIPALAQYLASHKSAIQDLQEKQRAAEKECDNLKMGLIALRKTGESATTSDSA